MPTSYTSLLGLALPVTGELSGTWGDIVNNSITFLLDTAIAGTTTVSADTTLTTTDGASNQARSAIIIASGHVANITITAPARSKIYTVINTSGTYTVTFRGVGPTTGVTLGVNEKAQLAWNGSDFVRIGGSGGAGVFSSITNSSLTSGRVVYSTTGGLETDSSNLTFNGTTLTANTLNLTNALGTTYGGTGLSSYTAGDLPYYASGTALSKLGIGTNGQILTSTGTAPQWSTLSGVAVTTFSAGTTGFTPSTATSGAVTLAGTLATTNGGTGLTSFTSGGVVYASSTSALTTGSALTFDGTTFGVTNSSASVALSATKSADGNTALFRRIGGTYNPGMYISLSDTVNNEIIFNTTYSLGNAPAYVWQNASSEQMRLTSTGLGIGTSSPTQKLHVVGDGNFTRATATDTFIQASNSVATFNITQSANGSTYLYNYGAYNLYFGTNSATRMTLDSSGNLGIGTSSPSYKLDVVTAGTSGARVTTAEYGQFVLTDGTRSMYLQNYVGLGSIGTSSNNALGFAINSVEKMRLDTSGNLGIGTSSPGAKLDVNGNVQIKGGGYELFLNSDNTNYYYLQNTGATGSANAKFEFVQGGVGTRLTLDSSGNLGLGVTPSAWGSSYKALENAAGFYGNFSTNVLLMGQNWYDSGAGSYLYKATGFASYYSQANGQHRWYTAPSGTAGNAISFTQAMTLDASGNLGIGTSSPSFKLDVAGGVARLQQGFQVLDTDGYFAFANKTVGATGNYGLYYSGSTSSVQIWTASSQRVTIDSSGNLIVGGTSTALGLVSVQGTGNYNAISAETSSSTAADTSTFVFRKTGTPSGTNTSTTGNIVFSDKYNNGTQADTAKIFTTNLTGSVVPNDSTATIRLETYSSAIGSTAVSSFRIGGTNGSALFVWRGYDGAADAETARLSPTAFLAGVDNTQTLGGSSRRWTTVYATTGTINTSDRNDKQDIKELSAAEQRVAARVKGLIRKFRFKDSVAAKGDNARIHFGVIAQDVQGAFTAEGLDASRYGLFCSDTFKAIDGKAVEKDENGQYPEGAIDYTRLGVRYEELLAFVISAI